jgi:hypothetical protein
MRLQLAKYISGYARRLYNKDVPHFSSNSDIFGSVSIVKPTRYTNVSNLFHFGMTLYIRGSQPVLRGALRAPRALPRGSAAASGK